MPWARLRGRSFNREAIVRETLRGARGGKRSVCEWLKVATRAAIKATDNVLGAIKKTCDGKRFRGRAEGGAFKCGTAASSDGIDTEEDGRTCVGDETASGKFVDE